MIFRNFKTFFPLFDAILSKKNRLYNFFSFFGYVITFWSSDAHVKVSDLFHIELPLNHQSSALVQTWNFSSEQRWLISSALKSCETSLISAGIFLLQCWSALKIIKSLKCQSFSVLNSLFTEYTLRHDTNTWLDCCFIIMRSNIINPWVYHTV